MRLDWTAMRLTLVVRVRVERRRGEIALGAAASKENLHFLFGLLERTLTRACELHAALEMAQRVVQRQVAPLELVDDGFELGQRAFEVRGGLVFGGSGFAGHDGVGVIGGAASL